MQTQASIPSSSSCTTTHSAPAFGAAGVSTLPKFRLSARRLRALMLGVVGAGLVSSSHAASDAWDGSTSSLWATATNWATDVAAPGAGETATFNGAGGGNTTIDLGSGVTIGSVVFDTSSTAAYTIGAGAAGSQTLSFGNAGVLTINSGVTAAQTINAGLSLNSAAGATTTITNNGTGLLSIAGTVNANVASGNGLLTVIGSGNTTISGAITKTGAGSNALKKTGSGTLTLSNGSVWSGTGASQSFGAGTNGNSAFTAPAIVQEGTLLLNGGTHAFTGELVIGGIVAQGGAGQNAKIQVDSGALTTTSWLSIGRGNGVGAVSSDLVLNNAATVTSVNLSAGYNGGNTLNLPKGSITLNGTSALTVTSTSANSSNFILGESDGSDILLTINDSATVNKTGGSVALGAATTAGVQIGKNAGKGAVVMNGGTFNASSVDLGRGSNNTQAVNGTLTLNAGSTFNCEGDFRAGFAGGASGQATLNVSGGTLNIGSTTGRWMQVGWWDPVGVAINVSSGNLNLNSGTSIQFSLGNNRSGPSVFTQTGGNVTFYSDNHTTVGGAGVLNLQNTGSASSNSTYHLNGGTLTVPQIMSSATTGSRIFNFNGGTLKAATDAQTLMTATAVSRANVRNGGALIDTNGKNVTIAAALQHSNIGGDNATDGGLTKSGAGTLTLSGVNTFTGNTTINTGTLALASTGSIANSAAIIANGTFDVSAVSGFAIGAAQTLKGSGTVNGSLTVNGTLAPGNSPGLLTFNNNLALGSSSTSQFEINGTTRGTTFDAVNVGGTLTYGGAISLFFNAPITAGTYDLFGGSSGGSPSGVAGGFATLSIGGAFAEPVTSGPVFSTGTGWTASSANWTYVFDNASGDLTIASAVPEPSAFSALAGLAGLGLVGARRRRRS